MVSKHLTNNILEALKSYFKVINIPRSLTLLHYRTHIPNLQHGHISFLQPAWRTTEVKSSQHGKGSQ